MSLLDRRLVAPRLEADAWVRVHAVTFGLSRLVPGLPIRWTLASSGGGTPLAGRLTPHRPRHLLTIDTTALPRGTLTLRTRTAFGQVRRSAVYKIEPGGALDNYLARAAWQPALAVVQAFDALIDQLVAADWWDRLDGLWACCADGLLPQTLNLKDDGGAFTLVPHNGPIRLARVGWKGNPAASAWLDTGCKVDGTHQFARDDHVYGAMVLEDRVESTGRIMGAGNGSDTARVGFRAYTGTVMAATAASVLNANYRVSSSVGLAGVGRRAAESGAVVHLFRDGLTAAKAVASTGVTAETLKLLTRRTDGGSEFSANTIAFAYAGGGADDDAHHIALHDAINGFLLAMAVIAEVPATETLPEGANYLTRAMGAGLPFEIVHSDPGPLSDSVTETNYSLFPLTKVYSGAKALRTTTWSGGKLHCLWENGARPERLRPNSLVNGGRVTNSGGLECRPDYSIPLLAMLSVEARVLWSRGATRAYIEQYLADHGWTGDPQADVIDLATVLAAGYDGAANAAIDATFDTIVTPTGSQNIYPSYATTLDKVLLPEWKISGSAGSGAKGFMLDMEPGDGRSEPAMAEHIERLAAICADDSHDGHAYRLEGYIVTPVNRPRGAIDHGFGINSLHRIHQAMDCLYLPTSHLNPERTGHVPAMIANQVAMLRGPDGDRPVDPARLGLYFIFGVAPARTSEQDALDAHDEIVRLGMHGAICFPQRASYGGDITRPTTLKQWRLAFGDATPGDPVVVPGASAGFDIDFEREDLITRDGSNRISVVLDVVNGFAIGQATSSKQPLWSATATANGRPGAIFDGVDDCLEVEGTAGGLFYGGTPCVIGIVSDNQAAAASGGQRNLFSYGASGGQNCRVAAASMANADSRARTNSGAGSGSVVVAENSSVEFTGQHVSVHFFDGTELWTEVDGVAGPHVSVLTNTPTGAARIRIGATTASTASGFWNGAINRVAVIPWTTEADLDAFRAQLMARTT